MLSSIFSSNLSARTALAVLAALLLLYVLTLEIAARTVVIRMSASLSREQADYRQALQVQPIGKSGKQTMLVIGNSLLFQGVVREQLVEQTASRFDVSLFPIEGTTFYDWHFGMQRFFEENARPAVVVLCINSRQMASDATNTEHFPHAMMRLRDYPDVVAASRLDTMTASNYLFSHWSMWLATRANVRNGLLERLMPSSVKLVPHFTVRGDASLGAEENIPDEVLSRLREFQQLVRAHGAEFAWVVPPTLYAKDAAPLVAAKARTEGIQVLIPYLPGELTADFFADGLHLNRQGAKAFTDRLAPALRAIQGPAVGQVETP